MKTFIFTYLGSALMTALITPVIIWLAHRLMVVDAPNIRKVHCCPVPRIGGVAIFASMTTLTVSVLFLSNTIGEKFRDIQPKVIALLAAGAFMFLVGLVDDIKGLRARTKFLCQLAAAVAVYAVGIRITSVTILDGFTINFGWFSLPLTVLWIVGVTNAVNLIDGLDGLAAGICAIACGAIVVLSIHFCQPVMSVIMLSLLGALTGFLFFNLNPAKIFMGDCGSLFLGFILASSSVMCAAKSQTIVGLTLPIIALGIPILDTLFSMLRRFLERRSIFSPDKGHFHHRLLALGLHQRQVVIIAYVITLIAAGLGMFMLFTRNIQTVAIFVCILLLLLLVFRATNSVGLQETIECLRKKYAISSHIKQERESFENTQLHFCQARTFDQWWQSLCLAADRMDFTTVSVSLTNRDGTKRILTWQKKRKDTEPPDVIKMMIPIPDRRVGPPLRLRTRVCTNGSLESAGRRATLFARLVEKYSIVNLPCEAENSPALS